MIGLLKYLMLAFLVSSCAAMPQFFDDAEKVLTDDCITIKVDKDAFQRDTDVKITVDVMSQDRTQIPAQIPAVK